MSGHVRTGVPGTEIQLTHMILGSAQNLASPNLLDRELAEQAFDFALA